MWRISGALVGACIFFIVTNLGVWLTKVYGLSIPGLVQLHDSDTFFCNSVLSTLCFSVIIEIGYKILSNKYKFKKTRNRQNLLLI